jgi:hypothetical protein
MRKLLTISLFLTASLTACGDKDLSTPSQCNPLGGSACITPWPSAIYEKDDATTETKRRVEVPKGALPTNFDGIEIEPAMLADQDGFSYAAPMIIAWESGVDGANLVDYKHIADSVMATSPTVIIDMESGELVHHFAELDAREPDKPASQALYIRPAKMLLPAHRYAVAIKKTLKAKGGGELLISEGFQAILDGEATSHGLLEKVRPRYTDIFAKLEAKGVAKQDLVVAWDFTTRSRANVQDDLFYARKSALEMMGTNASALSYTIDADTVPSDPRYVRRIDGTYDVPHFLTGDGPSPFPPSAKLNRDSAGHPAPMGLYKAPFTAMVPQCAMTATGPVAVIEYGHGLLGQAIDQVSSGGPRAAGAEVCAILIGTDMRGMSAGDLPNVATALNDANQSGVIFDALIQGMINHVALVQIAKGPMAQTLFVKTPGVTLVDPNKMYWYGISQGGIMGTTVCGIDPVIKRCVVQVNAINYSMMLERSLDWPNYRTILIGAYDDPLIVALMLNLMQQEWDRTEPVVVADVITGNGFPDTPAKQILMQMAIADDEVPNVASEYAMRTMNLPVMTPSPYVPFGVESAATAQSGAVLYDFGLGNTIPLTNTPPPANDVHGSIRNKKATTDMMKVFYETGNITNLCTGATGCDCTNIDNCGGAI